MIVVLGYRYCVLISVPTLHDRPQDFDWLFATRNQIEKRKLITFEFSSCAFLGESAVTFLGGLAREIEYARGYCDIQMEQPSAWGSKKSL
jgi:hypothetical protein